MCEAIHYLVQKGGKITKEEKYFLNSLHGKSQTSQVNGGGTEAVLLLYSVNCV